MNVGDDRGRKPPKPKRSYPGIAAVWSGGRWRWRACIETGWIDGEGVKRRRRLVGTLRETQRLAFDDVDPLRARAARESTRPWTLIEALNAVLAKRIESGLAPYVLERTWRHPCRRILRRWRGSAPLEALDVAQVRAWALACLDEGLAGPTVRKSRLRILHAAFETVGLPSPVPEVIRDLSKRLARRPKIVTGFNLDEAAAILARARAWRPLPGREAKHLDLDLLLLELAVTTGIRHDELARLRRRDVDLARGVIHVTAKVRSRPRTEPIAAEIAERLRRRCAELRRDEDPIVPGYGTPDPARYNAWEAQSRYLSKMRVRWQRRLREPGLHFRALRRAHGSGLDELGAAYAVVRDALGHSRTSGETPRYLLAGRRAVTEAKHRLASRLLGDPGHPPTAADAAARAEQPEPARVSAGEPGQTAAPHAAPPPLPDAATHPAPRRRRRGAGG